MILIQYLIIIKIRSCTAGTWGRMLWNLPDNFLKKMLKSKFKKHSWSCQSKRSSLATCTGPVTSLVSTTKLSKLRSIHATRSQLQDRVCPPAFTKQKVSHTWLLLSVYTTHTVKVLDWLEYVKCIYSSKVKLGITQTHTECINRLINITACHSGSSSDYTGMYSIKLMHQLEFPWQEQTTWEKYKTCEKALYFFSFTFVKVNK